jgi:hypothetical protein
VRRDDHLFQSRQLEAKIKVTKLRTSLLNININLCFQWLRPTPASINVLTRSRTELVFALGQITGLVGRKWHRILSLHAMRSYMNEWDAGRLWVAAVTVIMMGCHFAGSCAWYEVGVDGRVESYEHGCLQDFKVQQHNSSTCPIELTWTT